MHILNKVQLHKYLADDVILRSLQDVAHDEDGRFTSHRWIMDSAPKRMIFQKLYGDLLNSPDSQRVLDVGGGYTALSRVLRSRHDYWTMDIMAHDDRELFQRFHESFDDPFWLDSDWYAYPADDLWDVIIANDLFPNVDQRLAMFLEKYLPVCNELRLSLTYYNATRWYAVQRLDGDEIFHMMAWDGQQLRRVLEPYASRIDEPCLECLGENPPSLYANGRQVCVLRMRGG